MPIKGKGKGKVKRRSRIHETRPEEHEPVDKKKLEEKSKSIYDTVPGGPKTTERKQADRKLQETSTKISKDGNYFQGSQNSLKRLISGGKTGYAEAHAKFETGESSSSGDSGKDARNDSEKSLDKYTGRNVEQFQLERIDDPELGNRSDGKKYKCCLAITAGLAFISIVVITLWQILDQGDEDGGTTTPDGDDDDLLTPEVKKTLRERYKEWLNADKDKTFWDTVIADLKEEKNSYPMQLDVIAYLAAIAAPMREMNCSNKWVVESVNKLLDQWRRAGAPDDGKPLSEDADIARAVALYEAIRDLKAEDGTDANRYWRLRILTFVLARIVTAPRMEDDEREGTVFVGEWEKKKIGPQAGEHWSMATPKKDGEDTKTATFNFEKLQTGKHEVFATWPDGIVATNAADVPYQFFDQAGGKELAQKVVVNQKEKPRDHSEFGLCWKKIAEVNVPGTTLTVQLSNEITAGRVVADAILLIETIPDIDLNKDPEKTG